MPTTVCLSFDVDAYGPVLFEGDVNAALLSQGEFDAQVAVPRILTLLGDYELPATFFIPGHTADCFPRMVEAVSAAGCEIAHHGYLHEPPARLSADEEVDSLARGIESLKRITGQAPRGYRAPLWEPSSRTIGLLGQHRFAYDSSLMGTDFTPYWARSGDAITADEATLGPATGIVEVPSSWIFDDWSYFANARRSGGGGPIPPSHVREIWSEQVAFASEEVPESVVVMTMHPQVSGQGYVLRMLREFLGSLQRNDQVTFQSIGQKADAWREGRGGTEGRQV
jgi:peptidoglycan/xylan/chitin deacetylase (PgdA/CDA1 family)